MKCDELKRFDIVGKYSDEETMYEFRPDGVCYDADEVDAAIVELKRENERLEKCCKEYDSRQRIDERIKFDAAQQLRAAKRALWLARAERAASWQIHFSLCHNHSIEREFSINGASMPCEGMVVMRTARDWAMIWKKVERKCRAKAEGYK